MCGPKTDLCDTPHLINLKMENDDTTKNEYNDCIISNHCIFSKLHVN